MPLLQGVVPATFQSNGKLAAFYDVLSTNADRGGRVFASTIEGRKYPVFGSQWHPEKNIFEWTDREDIPHFQEAVRVAQYTANFFVDQARKSQHVFPFPELVNEIIYNFSPEYTYVHGSNFEQCYYWDRI